MGNVNQTVIVPLTALYGPPNTADQETFLDWYEEILSGYTDEILDAAVKKVVAAHVFSGWPKPAEIKRAADRLLPVPKPPDHFVNYDYKRPNEMVRARVQRLVDDYVADAKAREDNLAMPMPVVDRDVFQHLQRTSANFGLHMTPQGQRSYLETGRKPDHPKPDLANTDLMKQAKERLAAAQERGEG